MNTRDKADLETRLRRIAGQISGIERMIDGQRSPMEVVTQVSAVRAALAKVMRILLTAHLEQRTADAAQSTNARERRAMIDELVGALERLAP